MPDAQFAMLDGRGVLVVSGPERRSFLQGLVTNDVDKVSAERARYAALLTAQGRYLHDFIMIEVSDEIWLEAEAGRLADLRRRLSVFRLRAKANLDERAALGVAAIFGDAALDRLGLATEPGLARQFGGGVAFTDPRLATLGARCILPREIARSVLGAVAVGEAEFSIYDRLRLDLGVPDGSRDLDPERSLPMECGFDELNGIDWQKGCYIGQELTARMRYRGLVRRRLTPVTIDGRVPASGTVVTHDGREVGEMRSSCAELGLALLRIESVLAAAKLKAGEAAIVPRRPDWMRLPA